MKQFIKGPINDHARNIMQKLGYGEKRTRRGQISYAKRVGSERYPRYHVYTENTDNGIQINLHVDQKEASYENSNAHGGEYSGKLVESEMQRIVNHIHSIKIEVNKDTQAAKPKKQNFISKFFK